MTEMVVKEKKSRKKRVIRAKHVKITRSYKFAMDISAAQSKKISAACNIALDLRNNLV